MKIWPWSKFAEMDARVKRVEQSLAEITRIIRDRTSISADIGFHDSYVIAAGRLGGRDYVQCFRMRDKDFADISAMLKEMKRYGHVDFIDSPIAFRSVTDL